MASDSEESNSEHNNFNELLVTLKIDSKQGKSHFDVSLKGAED